MQWRVPNEPFHSNCVGWFVIEMRSRHNNDYWNASHIEIELDDRHRYFSHVRQMRYEWPCCRNNTLPTGAYVFLLTHGELPCTNCRRIGWFSLLFGGNDTIGMQSMMMWANVTIDALSNPRIESRKERNDWQTPHAHFSKRVGGIGNSPIIRDNLLSH
jgi:hypothetical protein